MKPKVGVKVPLDLIGEVADKLVTPVHRVVLHSVHEVKVALFAVTVVQIGRLLPRCGRFGKLSLAFLALKGCRVVRGSFWTVLLVIFVCTIELVVIEAPQTLVLLVDMIKYLLHFLPLARPFRLFIALSRLLYVAILAES